MTVQFDHVNSGPGTFTQYVRESRERLRHDYTFFSDDIDVPAGDSEVRIKPEGRGQLSRYRAYHEAFFEQHRKKPFDVVWYNTSPVFGVFSARDNLDIPMVQMVSDYSNAIARWPLSTVGRFGLRRSVVRSVLHRIERQTLRRSDVIIANSEYLGARIATTYGINPERIRVLAKGVDLSRFLPRETSTFDEPYRILFLKSDYLLGGIKEVFQAIGKFPHRIELTVAGPPDSEHDRIRSIARRVGCSAPIIFAGRLSRSEIPALIARHDIFCVPSHAEALGVSFLEALATGIPVVASNAGGIPEVLDNGRAGWMAKPFDSRAVRAALLDVIENEDERNGRVAHGFEHVRRYSTDTMLERLESLVDDTVSYGKAIE